MLNRFWHAPCVALLLSIIWTHPASGLYGDAVALTVDHPQIGMLVSYRAGSPYEIQDTQCTATLIGPDLAVTAAHCVFKIEPPYHPAIWLPQIGLIQVTATKHVDYADGQTKPPKPTYADLSLLRLKTAVRIPPTALELDKLTPGQRIRVVAHGPPQDFKKQSGDVVLTECKTLSDAFLCWQSQDANTVSTCDGDSGGALLVPQGNDWQLAGLVTYSSLGAECPDGFETQPVEYWNTRLGAFKNFFTILSPKTGPAEWEEIKPDTHVGSYAFIRDPSVYSQLRVFAHLPGKEIRILTAGSDCDTVYEGYVAQCEHTPRDNKPFGFVIMERHRDIEVTAPWTMLAIRKSQPEE